MGILAKPRLIRAHPRHPRSNAGRYGQVASGLCSRIALTRDVSRQRFGLRARPSALHRHSPPPPRRCSAAFRGPAPKAPEHSKHYPHLHVRAGDKSRSGGPKARRQASPARRRRGIGKVGGRARKQSEFCERRPGLLCGNASAPKWAQQSGCVAFRAFVSPLRGWGVFGWAYPGRRSQARCALG
jgi:hypothetical protein